MISFGMMLVDPLIAPIFVSISVIENKKYEICELRMNLNAAQTDA
jgi:hypothetical protein